MSGVLVQEGLRNFNFGHCVKFTALYVVTYVIRTNKMHTFFTNDLIQLCCLRHVSNNQVFILRKTCTCSFMVFFRHLYEQSGWCQVVFDTSWHQPDCLYGCMEKYHKTACTSSTWYPFLTWLSRHAQSGRWSSFGKWVWFTESNIVLVISLYFFYLLIFLYKKGVLYQVKKTKSYFIKITQSLLLPHSHHSCTWLTSLLDC